MKAAVVVVALMVAGTAAGQQDRTTTVGFDEEGRYYECGWIDWWTPGACGETEYMERWTGERPEQAPPPEVLTEAPEQEALVEMLAAIVAERMAVRTPEPEGGEEAEAAVEGQEAAAAAEPKAWQDYPLFPKDSLAPDAPALFAELLAEPTVENAVRYWLWYEERQARLQDAQDLIAEAALVVAARRGEPVPHVDDSDRGLVRSTRELMEFMGEPYREGGTYSGTLR